MKALIVDDEPLARARLRRLLAVDPTVVVVGEAGNTRAAETLLAADPDLVLLDIDMPGENGLAFARRLRERPVPPAIIFTTAHPQHALDAFASSPVDYLLKPIEAERLLAALQRARQPTRAQQEQEPRLTLHIGRQTRQLAAAELIAVLSEDKYTRVIYVGGEALIEQSLKELETRFAAYLIRLHRHSLVHRGRIRALERGADGQHRARIDGLDSPLLISRRCLPEVRAAFAGTLAAE
ncbi:LytR/AlgR family response regulator transcription factor [Halothiobacillus sp. DCM-1]|uniref:LytR/AlgR family response regulator transcription factor n=1 Tax=Halothiobacillus sp. DCM-1 TaxID=3112558 RepID=UPI0032514255